MCCCLMQILPLPLQRYRKEETKWNDLFHRRYTENAFVAHLLRGPGDFQMGIVEIYTSLKSSGVYGMQIERVIGGEP